MAAAVAPPLSANLATFLDSFLRQADEEYPRPQHFRLGGQLQEPDAEPNADPVWNVDWAALPVQSDCDELIATATTLYPHVPFRSVSNRSLSSYQVSVFSSGGMGWGGAGHGCHCPRGGRPE